MNILRLLFLYLISLGIIPYIFDIVIDKYQILDKTIFRILAIIFIIVYGYYSTKIIDKIILNQNILTADFIAIILLFLNMLKIFTFGFTYFFVFAGFISYFINNEKIKIIIMENKKTLTKLQKQELMLKIQRNAEKNPEYKKHVENRIKQITNK